jgi:hypothetical protein
MAGSVREDAQFDSLEDVVDGQFVGQDQAAGRPCARHHDKDWSVALVWEKDSSRGCREKRVEFGQGLSLIW